MTDSERRHYEQRAQSENYCRDHNLSDDSDYSDGDGCLGMALAFFFVIGVFSVAVVFLVSY
ncbi:hypothetical protein H8E88_35655 [candidate division KSB1 bacterium]|nr:hypothetical protein [candidate division KSB1 bacterium]